MAPRDQPGNGWTVVLRRRPARMVEGRPEGGYTDQYEIAPGPAGDAQPRQPEKKDSWAQRALAEPRLGLAMLVGALIGIPGASYLTALHNLVTGKSSTATQVIAVAVFVLIDFLLIIIPFAFLELRPEATKALLKHTQDWLLGHAVQLMAAIALLLGAYLAVSGLVRLS
jgi:Sap, sulfolipid-1-addressing protein